MQHCGKLLRVQQRLHSISLRGILKPSNCSQDLSPADDASCKHRFCSVFKLQLHHLPRLFSTLGYWARGLLTTDTSLPYVCIVPPFYIIKGTIADPAATTTLWGGDAIMSLNCQIPNACTCARVSYGRLCMYACVREYVKARARVSGWRNHERARGRAQSQAFPQPTEPSHTCEMVEVLPYKKQPFIAKPRSDRTSWCIPPAGLSLRVLRQQRSRAGVWVVIPSRALVVVIRGHQNSQHV